MSDAEVRAFLDAQRTVTCATLGPRGWPHLMPLWYVLRNGGGDVLGPRLWSWTYAVSQKVKNIERDARATLQVEAGETYDQLRGVMLECDVIVHRDSAAVQALGVEIFRRYAAARGEPQPSELDPAVSEMVARQAAKRVGLEFVERRRATWDHRKLAGAY
jgi:Pyridoxamine 5'-phosphate oxidase